MWRTKTTVTGSCSLVHSRNEAWSKKRVEEREEEEEGGEEEEEQSREDKYEKRGQKLSVKS